MNINIKRFSTLFLILVLFVSIFTTTAFAQKDPLAADNTITTEGSTDKGGTDNGGTDKDNTDNGGTDKDNTDNGGTDKDNTDNGGTDKDNTDNGGTDKDNTDNGGTDNDNTDNGGTDNDNTDNGGTDNDNTDIDGTDKGEKPAKPAPKVYVDTQKSRVEAAASQAAQATSDPDLLSSQSWDELLTSESESKPESDVEAAAGTVSEPQSPGIAGVSWILILGVVLIVLALCGIALFVYLQFFNNKIYKKKPYQDDETMVFEDISSDSKNQLPKKTNSPLTGDTKVFTNVKSSPLPPNVNKNYRRTPASEKEETAPIPQFSNQDLLSKSKAKPVHKTDFDFKKYFDDDDK